MAVALFKHPCNHLVELDGTFNAAGYHHGTSLATYLHIDFLQEVLYYDFRLLLNRFRLTLHVCTNLAHSFLLIVFRIFFNSLQNTII